MNYLKPLPIIGLLFCGALSAQTTDDFLWLEDIDGEKSMEFVQAHNKSTLETLNKSESFQKIYDDVLNIYNSKDRIAQPTMYGKYIYNFWQDDQHVRGIWRRAPQEAYLSGNPEWETLLDIDAMSEKDGIKWVFKGANALYPNYDRFLVNLSKGGGDAKETMEYDVNSKSFVADGFKISESKGDAVFIDRNTLIISTDFGEGTMTTSGYPRQARIWKRGTPISESKIIFEGNTEDVGVWGFVYQDGDKQHVAVVQAPSFFTSNYYIYEKGELIKINIPEDCSPSTILNDQLVITLKSDWQVKDKTWQQGALISTSMSALLKGEIEPHLIIQPDAKSSIEAVANTKSKLLVNLTTNVKNVLYTYSFMNNEWKSEQVPAPDFGAITIRATDAFSETYYFNFTNFLTPTSLYVADAVTNKVKSIKSLPAYFNSDNYAVTQNFAKSPDGTMVPYYMIAAKNVKYNGENPTLLYAYGGFEVSLLPYYSATVGKAWLENGGVYVIANIRGGSEYGPQWHQDGIKEKRQNVYNDFHAVAEDLISRKITSPQHLGIQGGSNGGLLMGVAFTQRPDLYNAVLCEVPLLDMKRFNKLLAGASWMGEYGNPDIPEEWAYISKYSPYQNLKPNANYPEVFFFTSTRDDRVHPGHARKMAAKMEQMGYKIYYYENIEGGHGGSSTNEQTATRVAMEYTYLLMKLKK